MPFDRTQDLGTTTVTPGFRTAPHYRTASPEEVWKTAIEMNAREQEYRDFKLFASLACLVAVGLVAIIIARRRSIAAAGENAVISTLASGVRVKRRIGSYTDQIRARVIEKVDGEKDHPRT